MNTLRRISLNTHFSHFQPSLTLTTTTNLKNLLTDFSQESFLALCSSQSPEFLSTADLFLSFNAPALLSSILSLPPSSALKCLHESFRSFTIFQQQAFALGIENFILDHISEERGMKICGNFAIDDCIFASSLYCEVEWKMLRFERPALFMASQVMKNCQIVLIPSEVLRERFSEICGQFLSILKTDWSAYVINRVVGALGEFLVKVGIGSEIELEQLDLGVIEEVAASRTYYGQIDEICAIFDFYGYYSERFLEVLTDEMGISFVSFNFVQYVGRMPVEYRGYSEKILDFLCFLSKRKGIYSDAAFYNVMCMVEDIGQIQFYYERIKQNVTEGSLVYGLIVEINLDLF